MKLIAGAILFLLMWITFSSFRTEPGTKGDLVIEIKNIERSGGTIWFGIYDSEENFLVKEKAIVKGYQVDHSGNMRVKIPALPYGPYAIAIFHDVNNNGILDRNLAGIPSEPFAFSQKPTSKWRLPRFSEIRFQFRYSHQVLSTRLSTWWDQ